MLRWEHLATASVPGGDKLSLHRRGDEYSIRVSGQELMNSRMHGSEEELAHRVCAGIRPDDRPCVLVGGLGLGFTLAAALAAVGPKAEVLVAEVVPAVVMWNRKWFGHLAGDPLLDPRVRVHEGDVARLLRGVDARYEGVLLDVDNGPEALCRDGNGPLYSLRGLADIARALTPTGTLGVWSAGPDRRFNLRLHQAGFEFEELRVHARTGGGGGRHTLWIATRPELPGP